jgi:hypothetical protein
VHDHGCGRNEHPKEASEGGHNLLSQSGRAKTFHEQRARLHTKQQSHLVENPYVPAQIRTHRSGNFIIQPLKLGVAFPSSSMSTSRQLLSREAPFCLGTAPAWSV